MKKMFKITLLTLTLLTLFMPKAEARRFWGTEVGVSEMGGCVLTVTHTYIFWIETSETITLDCP